MFQDIPVALAALLVESRPFSARARVSVELTQDLGSDVLLRMICSSFATKIVKAGDNLQLIEL
jgi:hypothetical protein